MARRLPQFALLTLAAYWLLLFVLTHVPNLPVEGGFSNADKVAHFLAYALLAWLAAMALRVWHIRIPAILLVVLLGGAAYGALDEFLQGFTGRDTDVYDWVADVLGLSAGLLLFLATHRMLRKMYHNWAARLTVAAGGSPAASHRRAACGHGRRRAVT